MENKRIIFTWFFAKFIVFGLVFLFICGNYLFGGFRDFWFDTSQSVDSIRSAISPGNINKRDEEGRTALMIAAQASDTDKNQEIVRLLVENGADVNLRVIKVKRNKEFFKPVKDSSGVMVPLPKYNQVGNTALHFACERGNINIVKYLLEHYANPLIYNDREGGKAAPIHFIAKCQNEKHLEIMIEWLVARGFNINFPDKKMGMSVLFWTFYLEPAKLSSFELLQAKYPHLIDFEMKVGGKDLKQFAKSKLSKDEFKESLVRPSILQRWRPEMNPNAFDRRYSFNYNFTITMVAAIKGRDEYLQNLIQNGANLNLQDRAYGNTPLNWALICNRPKILEIVLINNANARIKNKDGKYPIHYLFGILKKSDRKKVAKSLFNGGADFNAQDKNGNTFLHLAVLLNDYDLVKLITSDEYFIERVNFNKRNKNNRTALDIAKKRKDKKMIEMLAKYNGFNELTDREKGKRFTLLMLAAMRGNFQKVQAILSQNESYAIKELNKQNSYKDTALHLALRFRHPEIARFLIYKGAKTNVKNRNKNTELHELVYILNPQVRNDLAKMLLEKGADISDPNKEGDTVMHAAVKKNLPQLVKFLIDNFGKLAKNKKGTTALDLAKTLKNQDIINMLKKR